MIVSHVGVGRTQECYQPRWVAMSPFCSKYTCYPSGCLTAAQLGHTCYHVGDLEAYKAYHHGSVFLEQLCW
jgi:hypothetical protein